MRTASFLLLFSLATPVAGEISFQQPIDCELGQNCFIQNYVDSDPSDQANDFMCRHLTYNAHRGTDFALHSDVSMQDGVSVLAASDGVVIGLRNSMLDIRSNAPQAPALGGQECGNGVVLDHGDGWETQYCHLKKGSVTQSLGQSVQAGEVLGEVGLSGQTEFPHLHLSIRKDGQVVDPFTPKHATCGSYSSADALWQQPIDYVPAGLISIGFADAIPDFSNISKGTAHIKVLPTQTPALVLFASVFGASDDLSLGFRIEGPNGIFHEAKASFETDQAQAFRASGRNVNSTLAPGIYQGTVTLLRGNQIIGHRRVDVTITK